MNEDEAPAIRVLVVEDNPGDAKIIAELFSDLGGAGFSLARADSLEKARLAAAREQPDVVLLDLNLPDSFGPDTLTKARGIFSVRPIIVLTGFYEEQLGLLLIKRGAQDYLVKGKITGDWLASAIRYAIERFRLEGELKARETRLKTILENSPDGFVITSGGKTLFVNPGAERIFGLTREELLARALPLEARPGTAMETELTRHDGKKVPLEVRAVDIQWSGAPCRLVILRDLGAVRSLQKSRDEFISMVSHELRSPLTVVKEALQICRDGELGPVSERQKELLDMGLDNAARLNRLIDGMLDITKIEAGVMPLELARRDLGELAAATTRDYSIVAAERGVALAYLPPSKTVASWCDGEKTREVLTNLVSNALKFTPRGGSVKISLDRVEDLFLFCVENTGEGIDPDDLPKLFQKFSRPGRGRAKNIKGTGLGLAISRGIVEMHGGRIWAESRPGKWCRFSFVLPLLDYRSAAAWLARRELESAAAAGGVFSCVTALVGGTGNGGERAEARGEDALHGALRNSCSLARNGWRDLTLLLSGADAKEACKVSARLAGALSGAAGGAKVQSSVFSYPADFTDEAGFLAALDRTRKEHEKDTADRGRGTARRAG